jgi:Bacterial Ig-like domain (group 3)
VTVTPQYPGRAPAGTVTIKTSGTTLCTITLAAGHGTCHIRAARLKTGTYHPAASYRGNANFKSSMSRTTTLTITG